MGNSSHNQQLSNKTLSCLIICVGRHWIIKVCCVVNAGPAHSNHLTQQKPRINFYIKGFFSASKNRLKLESKLYDINPEPVLESWDIGTQTDFHLQAPWVLQVKGNSNFLGLDSFDMQPQTGLNLWWGNSPYLPWWTLKHSSFSWGLIPVTQKQTERIVTAKDTLALEKLVETQMMSNGCENLRNLFFTSNETPAVDDFLLCNLIWNTLESQFSRSSGTCRTTQSPASENQVHLCNAIYNCLLKLKNREQSHQCCLDWIELIMVALILGSSLPFVLVNVKFVYKVSVI